MGNKCLIVATSADKYIAKRKGGRLEPGRLKSEFFHRVSNDLLKPLLSLNSSLFKVYAYAEMKVQVYL